VHQTPAPPLHDRATSLTTMQRVVALDYGSARCGVAVSDPTGTLATPLDPALKPNTRKGFNRLLKVIREQAPATVVVGLPLSLSGRDSAQTREARAFAERLADALDSAVELYDERFTTALAQQRPGSAPEDSRAAAVLLEEWLAVHR
ncbi:MAG TPA: Holliday junction resolvase RuvX, partial [Solirubrobacteraceae bacterium]|nr:Holliday junction resolvase RuvX [Solirubrobacteraceae bacterium]